MRSERLTWADRPPAVEAGRRASDRGGAPIANVQRRWRLIDRAGVRVLARFADAIGVMLVTAVLCTSMGIDLWLLPLGAALPFILLPAGAVGGMWLAGAYRFGYAGQVAVHLLRATVGCVAGIGAVFLFALATGFPLPALFANI